MSKNFRFWIPLDKIEKAVGEDGKVILRLGGIASTVRRDTDGESLDPSQFDVSYLKEKGIINWNHSKNPEAVIGEPTKVEFKKAGMYVESELYAESELAQKVYKLAEVLNKNSKKRRLGYSVEGKALTRDPLDPTKIGKAMITNLALTISPKNPDSIVDIIKGEFHEFSDEDLKKGEIDPIFNIQDAANGGETSIIVLDITRPDGTRITVDSAMNTKIMAKGLDTVSGRAVIPEHLDGQPKKNFNKDDDSEKCISSEGSKYLTKAEVFDQIFLSQPVISLETANEIYENLNTLTNTLDMSSTKITNDLLQKSLVTLGLAKENTTSKISKGIEHEEEEEDEEEEEEPPKKKPVKKSMTSTTNPSKEGAAGANGGKENIQKGAKGKDKEEEEEDEEEEEYEEPKPKKKFMKSKPEGDNDTKELIKSLAIIAKGSYDLMKSINDKLSDLGEGIQKSNDAIDELGRTPIVAGRRSVANAATIVDRAFDKGEDLIKSQGNEFEQQGANTLSVSRQKSQVIELMDNMTFEKGFDNEMATAMTTFEAGGTLLPGVVQKIKSSKGIVLVP